VYALGKLENFPSLTSVMSQELALQQDASQLKTSANHWKFSIYISYLLRVHFPWLNSAELHHYRVACIIVLPFIKFKSSPRSSSSSSLSLVFLMYTFSTRLLQDTRCWQALKNELN
jgi:hypothetical protein